jgi:D-glucuronyl C5-epimerase-like protein
MGLAGRLRVLAIETQRLFPLSCRMRRRYRMPRGDPAGPYYLIVDPGGGAFGERWNEFDERGILRNGGYYNPVSIAHYALHCYDRLYAGDSRAREPFMRHVEYLMHAKNDDGSYAYDIPYSQYGIAGGWHSSMAQGEAASVFLRAYAVTSSRRYIEAALHALEPLQRDVSEGGTSLLRGDLAFFEEVAEAPCHILNGHLCAAFGVWDVCRAGFAPPRLRAIHETAIRTLQRWLPRFDAKGWSYYQLAARDGERHYATLFYHQTHIAQLDVYAEMTGCEEFRTMSRRWYAGLRDMRVRARVWADIGNWALRSVRRRLHARTAPWRSIMLEDAAP